MFGLSILTILKIAHLCGLIMGFGGAIAADLTILTQAVMKNIRRETIEFTEKISYVVFAGLGLLWFSGIALVYIRVSADPHVWMNEKIWAKVMIVAILTINGVAVHRIALKHLAKRCGQRLFDAGNPVETAGLTFIAAVSSVSWMVPFVLGVASELNFNVEAQVVLAIYATVVLAAWCAMFALARLASSWNFDFERTPGAVLLGAVFRSRLKSLLTVVTSDAGNAVTNHGLVNKRLELVQNAQDLQVLAEHSAKPDRAMKLPPIQKAA